MRTLGFSLVCCLRIDYILNFSESQYNIFEFLGFFYMDDTVKKILSCMKMRNITDKQLTKDIGINKSAVTDWKTGKTKSYKKYIDKIAEYLGVSVDYLLGRTDDPLPKIQIQDTIMAKGDYVGPVNPAEKQWLEAALAAYREALQKDLNEE
jgi:transcriptional regulator with XRE-family HTH domain|nr:MAG TPA: Repressor protein CI [Bacteriophage sp.]